MSTIIGPDWQVEIIDYDLDGPQYQGTWNPPETVALIKELCELSINEHNDTRSTL